MRVAPVFEPLLAKSTYKAAYGGRASGKSHFFADLLITRCRAEQTRAVCIREVQKSIRDSVRLLLVDKIRERGFQDYFECLETEIRGKNGSLITFLGMNNVTQDNIKSLEGFDIAWSEEAQNLSDRSLTLLIPTIRKKGSELWFSWNPNFENDAVDMLFRGTHPPTDSVVVEANWNDNPWLTERSRSDKDDDYRRDADKAEHVWGGAYNTLMEGSYYSRLLLLADKEKRIGQFPHNPSFPVWTAWDLGTGDDTSIVFAQRITGWVHIIDHYYNNQQPASHYVDVLKRKPYTYAGHYLPHDAERTDGWINNLDRLGSLKRMGLADIKVLDRVAEEDGINAARILLPICRFDKEKCDNLLKSLRHYHAKYDDIRKVFMPTSVHDWSSHDADAFRYLAMGLEPEAAVPIDIPRYSQQGRRSRQYTTDSGWAA
jgi:phage terminase large subunit